MKNNEPCAMHLPGNVACPYLAIWRIAFAVNEPRAYETVPPSFRVVTRVVCSAHLEAAMISDLEHVPASDGFVTVSLA